MKKFYIFAFAGIFFFTAKPQSQGPNSPTAAFSVSTPQGTPWTNPTNVFASDVISASCTMPGYPSCAGNSCYYSQCLNVTGFGFSIPANANIKGIVVDVKRRSTNFPAHVNDSTVKLLRAGLPVGLNKADTAKWGLGYVYISHGDSTDLWGAGWTPADINDPNFGVYFSAMVGNNVTGPPQVDHIRIKVYYDTTTTSIALVPDEMPVIFPNPAKDLLYIKLPRAKFPTCTILDITGRILFTAVPEPGASSVFSVPVAALPEGIYFLRITNGETVYMKKFIK